MNGKKIIVFEKLTILNIVIFIFFKLFNFNIYYVSINNELRKKKIINTLSYFNINWFNYEDFDCEEIYANSIERSKIFADKISEKISKNIWSKKLEEVFIDRNYLSACLNHKIKKRSIDIIELLEVAKILKKKNKIYVCSENSYLFKEINQQFYRIKNINLFLNLKHIKIIFFFIKNIFFKFVKKLNIKIILNRKNTVSNYKNLNAHNFNKIAFFPHKGMYVQNLLKDHFYSKNKKSIFNKNKITHVEWSKEYLDVKSYQYYSKNKIKLIFWNNLDFKKETILELSKFIFKTKSLIFDLYNKEVLFFFYISATQIIHSKKKLQTLHNLKLILVGYDNLFPPEISVASKHLKIKTLAMQDRVIVPSWVHKMIFDYYIVIGKKSYDIVKLRMNNSINNIICHYLIKTDKYKIKIKKNNYGIKKFKYKCLVIDLWSLPKENWYKNGRVVYSWKTNKKFYYEIIYLANKFQNIEFLIKSKNYKWVKNLEFIDILEKIKKIPNIKILNNKKIWTPVKSVLKADFAIARYSSLGDELLYLNKPLIIYDLKGFPQKYLDFGKNIISHNIMEVEKKIDELIKNYNKYNLKLNRDRNKLLFKKKNKDLNSILENIISSK